MAKRKNMPLPLKTFGGKNYLSEWLGSMLPKHIHRVHLFAGGLGEAKTWPIEGFSLVANDIHSLLMNFYRVLRDDKLFVEFMRQITAVPFSREEWEMANDVCEYQMQEDLRTRTVDVPVGKDVDWAVAFFIWNRQSMGGRMEGFTPLTRNRTRGDRNAEINSWLSSIDGLPGFKTYLDHYVLECNEAIKVLKREDGPNSFFYSDPTYITSSTPGEGRSTKDVYAFEMTLKDHEDFLKAALEIEGKIMISAYRCELYDDLLSKWTRKDKIIDNKSAKGPVKRKMVESVYLNYPESDRLSLK